MLKIENTEVMGWEHASLKKLIKWDSAFGATLVIFLKTCTGKASSF